MTSNRIAPLVLALGLLWSLVCSEQLRVATDPILAESVSSAMDSLSEALRPGPALGNVLRRIFPARALSSHSSGPKAAQE